MPAPRCTNWSLAFLSLKKRSRVKKAKKNGEKQQCASTIPLASPLLCGSCCHAPPTPPIYCLHWHRTLVINTELAGFLCCRRVRQLKSMKNYVISMQHLMWLKYKIKIICVKPISFFCLIKSGEKKEIQNGTYHSYLLVPLAAITYPP